MDDIVVCTHLHAINEIPILIKTHQIQNITMFYHPNGPFGCGFLMMLMRMIYWVNFYEICHITLISLIIEF